MKNRARDRFRCQLYEIVFCADVAPPTELQLMAAASLEHQISTLHEKIDDQDVDRVEILMSMLDMMAFLAVDRASEAYPKTVEAFDSDPMLASASRGGSDCGRVRIMYCLSLSMEAQIEFSRLHDRLADVIYRCLKPDLRRNFAKVVAHILKRSLVTLR